MPVHKDTFNPDPTDRVKRNFEIVTEIVNTMSTALGKIHNCENSTNGAATMKAIALQALLDVHRLADSIDVVLFEKKEVAGNA